MAKNKKKYYVVWIGKTPGVYEAWKDCQAQISGFPNAKYKSFPSLAEAQAAFTSTYDHFYSTSDSKAKRVKDYKLFKDEIIENSLSVDAACSGNPGKMEYQGVNTKTKELIFRQGPFAQGTNNIGEFLALVHGLAYFKAMGSKKQVIYSDSKTAMAWVRNKKVRTKLTQSSQNAVIFDLIKRAEKWLADNTWDHRILKWNTEKWGEIPADFGRK